jgi:hypothetical protein
MTGIEPASPAWKADAIDARRRRLRDTNLLHDLEVHVLEGDDALIPDTELLVETLSRQSTARCSSDRDIDLLPIPTMSSASTRSELLHYARLRTSSCRALCRRWQLVGRDG